MLSGHVWLVVTLLDKAKHFHHNRKLGWTGVVQRFLFGNRHIGSVIAELGCQYLGGESLLFLLRNQSMFNGLI